MIQQNIKYITLFITFTLLLIVILHNNSLFIIYSIAVFLIFFILAIFTFNKYLRFIENKKVFKNLKREIEKDEKLIRLYEDVFTNTNNGIVVTDKVNRIIKVNNAFTEITEYSSEEAIGKTPSILKSGRQSKEFYKEMWSSLAKYGHWNGEVWNKKKYGDIYPQWLSISVVKSKEDGQILHYVSNFSDISIIKESQEALEYMAHHDSLTGLANRVLLKSYLDNFIKTRKREKNIGAVLYLDLDKFKFVNDTYGHATGDEILKGVAKRLIDSVRDSDIVGRVGGDEFIILLRQISSKDSLTYVAKKIVDTISESFNDIVEEPLYIGTSIGISIFPEQSDNIEEIIKYADIAMFEAKEGGRNGYQFYSPNMSKDILERTSIERDLRSAVLHNEFVLYYQPQIDVEKNQVFSAEALIRWKHPKIGLMPPIKFINIAEESELIIEIGKWVIFQACSQMVQWRKNNVFIEKVSVNVSTVQFLKTDMAKTVIDILKKTKCDPHFLEIEITESVLIQNKESMLETLRALGKIGVAFSIDDFGTGYSSLSYLKQLPFHAIKIDRSFIMEIPHNKDDIAITQSIIALGKSFNYKIIAEGVETEEQLEFLKELNCDLIQGFFYAQPMSAQNFVKFYKDIELKNSNLENSFSKE